MKRRDFLKGIGFVVAAPAIVRYDSLMKPVPLKQPLLTTASMDITIDQMRHGRLALRRHDAPPHYYYLQIGGVENVAAQEWSNRVKAEIINNLIIGKV